MEIATMIANYAADELQSTRKELRHMNDQHEKIYNEKAALEEKVLEMEKKMLAMDAKLTFWSTEHILTEYEAEWSKAVTDINKIRMIEAKYDIACKMDAIVKKSCQ